MENNQHSSNKNAVGKQGTSSFANNQPGQQLPTGNSSTKLDESSSTETEQHSESSKPENDNETLGTP